MILSGTILPIVAKISTSGPKFGPRKKIKKIASKNVCCLAGSIGRAYYPKVPNSTDKVMIMAREIAGYKYCITHVTRRFFNVTKK